MTISLAPNSRSDPTSRIWLNIDGRRYPAWLSPDLTNFTSPERKLVLVNLLPSEVPVAYRPAFIEFSNRVFHLDERRLASAKRAVVKIATQEWQNELYRIAVHKMGPVPAFAFEGVDISPPVLSGKAATVVAFPRAAELPTHSAGTSHFKGTLDLFNSLLVTDVSLLFRCYFEDIFAHLKDMSDKLSLIDCMKRVKAIREVLSESISSKIDVLTPSLDSWADFRRGKLQAETHEAAVSSWFQDHYDLIGEAVYLACIANRCISEFLSLLGMGVRERTFEIRKVPYVVETCRMLFSDNYSLSSQWTENSEVMSAVDQVYSTYATGDIDALRGLDVIDRRAKDLRDFLVFVATATRELVRIFVHRRFISRDSILFVSRRFASPFGATSMTAIQTAAEEVSSGQSKVTTFEGEGGEPIRAAVKAQIWLSDALWSIVPEQDKPVGRDLTWLYLEAEHAFVLGKRSLVVARNEDDLETVKERMARVKEPMLAEALVTGRDELRRETLAQFGRDVALVAGTESELKNRAIQPLRRLRLEAGQSRRRNLLIGYLRLFEPSDARIFRLIFRNFGNRSFTRRQFETIAVRSGGFSEARLASQKFVRAYERSKRHGVIIDGKTYQVIQLLPGRTTYRFDMIKIGLKLANVGPTSDEEVQEDLGIALDEAVR